MRQGRNNSWSTLSSVLVLAICLFGCQPSASATPGMATIITSWRDLAALPGADLAYPGASIISSGGTDASRGLYWGTDEAMYGRSVGTNATEDDILTFYMQQLPTLGWTFSPSDLHTMTSETRGLAWRRGKTVYLVTFFTKGDPRNPKDGQYATYYAARLEADKPIR